MTEVYKFPSEIPKAAVSSNGAGESVCSVEETNRIRIALGLKPLNDKQASIKEGDAKNPILYETSDVKARKKKEKEKKENELASKIASNANERKLMATKSLGEEDEPDDAASWVAQARKKAKARELAQKRERELEEQEKTIEEYTSKDLKGLKVGHAAHEFEDDSVTIMTLKDTTILGDEEDELENIDMVNARRDRKNAHLRKAKAYNGGLDMDTGEKLDILYQYNDVDNKDMFKETITLGDEGVVDEAKSKRLAEIRRKLNDPTVVSYVDSLDTTRVATRDFYTADEMTKFKKKKGGKERKLRKKKKEPKFDLEAVVMEERDLTGDADANGQDHGSRAERSKAAQEEKIATKLKNIEKYQAAVQKAALHSKSLVSGEFDAEQEDEELYSSLARARRLAVKKEVKKKDETKLAEQIARVKKEDEEEAAKNADKGMTFNPTQEFVRSLDQRIQVEREEKLEKAKQAKEQGVKREPSPETDFKPMDISEPVVKKEEEEDGDGVKVKKEADEMDVKGVAGVLADEPLTNRGAADALKYLRAKGQLKEVDERMGRNKDGSVYIPRKEGEFHLQYQDPQGRVLSQKEAYRQLSHRFHGKQPGLNKQQKYEEKAMEMLTNKHLGASGAPLTTIQALQAQQTATRAAHVVLSGSQTPSLSLAHSSEPTRKRKKEAGTASEVTSGGSNMRKGREKVGFGIGGKRKAEGDEPAPKRSRK